MALCSGYTAPTTTTTTTPTATTTTGNDHDARRRRRRRQRSTTTTSTTIQQLLELRLSRELRRSGDHARRSRGSTRSRAGCAVECPWDREQDERTIVPHTLEEAYELADAAAPPRRRASCSTSSATCSSRSTSSRCCWRSAAPATSRRSPTACTEKLIRRHPHVFGEAEVADAGEVLRNWDAIKATEPDREPGVFGEVPENLPWPAVRAQGAAPRRLQRLRLSRTSSGRCSPSRDELEELAAAATPRRALPRARRRAVRGRQRRAQTARRPGARAARRRRTASAAACRPASTSPHPTGGTGTISLLTSSSATTRAPA